VTQAAPTLIYGYGAYGISLDAEFSAAIFNLVDRGFVYALAHVRGGQEMGRSWYDAGRLLNKNNSFDDFVAASEYLVERGIADQKRLYAQGGSAGGLLMATVANRAGSLFHGLVIEVPFVDVVTTMLDNSIPLTTSEYDEWGDPSRAEVYNYLLGYSPYDNLHSGLYPNILVLAGFHDSQVQYWEPAKWVAKLRELKRDQRLLLLDMEMNAGHGGASGRYDRYRELAKIHAFLLMLSSPSDPLTASN
jgi:oligopeptidase B